MSLSTELCVKVPTGMCFHGSVSPRQPGDPQRLRLVTACQCPTVAPLKSNTGKSSREEVALLLKPGHLGEQQGRVRGYQKSESPCLLIPLWCKKESQSGVGERCVNFAVCL